MRSLRLRLGAAALALAAGLIGAAVACGGSSPTATPQPTTPPTKAASSTTAAATSTSAPAATATSGAPTATATAAAALPSSTATPTAVAATNLPQPKSPKGTVTIAVTNIASEPGINHAQGGEASVFWGATETLFNTKTGPVFGEPWLAKEWTVAPDLSKVTIKIQTGVQFHQGFGEMTAEDVVWSINDASARTNPTSIHAQAGDLAPVFLEWKVIDSTTVEAPFNTFDVAWQSNALSTGWQPTAVFSKKVFDQKGEAWMKLNLVGTGPYQAQEWTEHKQIVLNAVKNHWRKSPQIDTLKGIEIPEASTRLAVIKTGEADVADIALADIPALLKAGYALTGTSNGTELNVPFAGNLWETRNIRTGEPLLRPGFKADAAHPWIGDPVSQQSMEKAKMVRTALSMAIDREAINDTLAAGLGWLSYIGAWNPRMPQYNKDWVMPYDPDKAKKMIADAGYPNGFSIAIFGQSDTPIRAQTADAIGGFWSNIGLKVEVRSTAYSAFRPSIVDRSADIPFINSCDDGRFPRPWDWPAMRTLSTLSRGGFSCGVEVPTIAENWLRASKEADIQKRVEINNQVAAYMWEWQVMPSTITIPVVIVYNPAAIKEWKINPSLGGPVNTTENIVPAR